MTHERMNARDYRRAIRKANTLVKRWNSKAQKWYGNELTDRQFAKLSRSYRRQMHRLADAVMGSMGPRESRMQAMSTVLNSEHALIHRIMKTQGACSVRL